MICKKKIHTEGRNFVTEDGKIVCLHGINMVCKDRTTNHIGDYKETDFEYLKRLNMNLIRLGIFWESVEPQPGVYDDEYLKKIKGIIDKARKQNIYVYLDMHQDLYGAKFEDGAPDWAVIDKGLDHVRTELWSESYLLSPAVQTAFDSFWNNEKATDGIGIKDHFIGAWCHVAEYFCDEPYVIGYDFFNEPFIGSEAVKILPIIGEVMEKLGQGIATEEDLVNCIGSIEPITAEFEEKYLNSFYGQIVKAVRKSDPECLVMLETNYFSNAAVPTHIKPVEENGIVLKNQVFAPHGYDIFVDTDKYEETDNTRVDMIFMTHAQIAEKLNLPILIGEWGCYPNANETQVDQARHLLELFRGINAADTYFDFSHIYGNRIAEALKFDI